MRKHSPENSNSPRILLAEDDAISQKVASLLLTRSGCVVDIVNNGKEALQAWESGEYDAVLMDCQMPGMDGFNATRAIRHQEEIEPVQKRTPIIALTAFRLHEYEERCRNVGMDAFLTKPLNFDQLLKTLASFCGCQSLMTKSTSRRAS